MIRAVIVDDEEPARDRLQVLLGEFDDVEVVGVAEDVDTALAAIEETAPHVVFLDIQMPGGSGLELTAALPPPRPRIIFCTAFDHYALDAFEQDAVDYLLKPLNRGRLARAVERVRTSIAERETLQQEVEVASRAQARLLPQALPSGALTLSGVCRPARGVGGDYYDVLPLDDDRLGLVVGDVSGKGLYAGLLMAGLQGRLQTLAPRYGERLDELMVELNRRVFASTDGDKYATLFYAVYDDRTRRLRYVNAGHTPPLLVGADGRVRRLASTSTAVGLMPDPRFEQATVDVAAGDTLVVYSDGVTEAMNGAGEEFGDGRLERLVVDGRHLPPPELQDAVLNGLDAFVSDEPQRDDVTLLVAHAVTAPAAVSS
jgi:serine phosphatase RsbU (regulator of sigma subunit)